MAKRRAHHEEHEEDENHERWLITYADMITLLMAFFIMLFVMSQTDLAKFKKFQEGLAGHYGKKVTVKQGDGVLIGAGAHLLVSDRKAQEALQSQAKQSA